ncbi:eukaryotic translation initiation factor 5B isoform X2 [Cyprinus carpio]|uniref:Eukaryotic translation initiation factor 5B isoform X2 n=1 Tax=Cyprinus carpio TaxID=7962 RepID=A0A9R0A8N8_CYPCA|nr:eukaryotic translation initiation factor 5B isoform X2 [Cyprinus carpio]
MEEQTVNQLDNLLLQLGIETRELAQKKDDLKQQIQICESNIQEKKDYISTTHKSLSRLSEEVQQKQNTLRFIKENTKNLQRTGHLLLQYEKTLEAELEKRRDGYNQDVKIFQERMESYRNVFQQYKDRYCQNSLAQKLLKIQAENEEIERRIRATEEQILEKETMLMAALGEDEPVTDAADSKCQDNDVPQTENRESFDEMDPYQDPIMQRPEEYADEGPSEENKDKTAESESQTDTFHHGLWTKAETGEDQMQEGDQKQSEEANELEGNMNVSCASELMVEISEEEEEERLEVTTADAQEDTVNERGLCPPPSPARIKAMPTTPTFSLNNSPSSSPGRQEISDTKSPAFVFSMNSGPSTPAFSKLGCDFAAEEASPFTFTSSYFSDRKSPGLAPKFSGFLFDEAESRQEEFSFSFGTVSPQQNSSTQDTAGSADSFPFSFSFGKMLLQEIIRIG